MNNAQRSAKLALNVRRYKVRHQRLAEARHRLEVQRLFETEDQRRMRASLERLRLQDWSAK